MRPTGDHVNRLDLIPAHLKLHYFTCNDVVFLNPLMTQYHNELFPLAVVPVLIFFDTELGDVDTHLTEYFGSF